jgi:hypothetical protein
MGMRPQNSVMLPPFDIFRVETDGHLVWKDTAETLVLARLRIKILMVSQPGDFVIYSQETGHKTVVKSDGSIIGPAGRES